MRLKSTIEITQKNIHVLYHKTRLLLFVLYSTCEITSCSDHERSEIEIVKYDKQLIAEIQSTYDSSYVLSPKRKDFWTIEHYLTDSAQEKIIFKDSLKNIVGVVIQKNKVNLLAQECYSNGQLRGKVNYVAGEFHGPATYYYENGRIRSKGTWDNNRQVGEWRDYDKDGYLISVKYYNSNGQLEKEEVLK